MTADLPSPDDLDEDALIAAFEGPGFAPGAFHHRHHVRLAWAFLERRPLLEVLERFTTGLRRLAAAAGKPELYPETVTWAYGLLGQERRLSGPGDWTGFAAANADLLAWKPSVLEARYYRSETLWSDRARHVFVWPDRERGDATA
jgi:N-formylglutamate deformylase